MHAVWKVLLDDDFLHAYNYGIVINCHDGVERRVYPRIFTYSADYPEKYVLSQYWTCSALRQGSRVLLATIRDKGACPCPRCLVTKEKLNEMGLKRDLKVRENKRQYFSDLVQKAQNLIYNKAAKITRAAVSRLLKPSSSVPTVVSLKSLSFLSFSFLTPIQIECLR